MIRYQTARQIILEKIGEGRGALGVESVALAEALGRVLARDVVTDRAYPAFDRATRDGYAVRAGEAGAGARLECVGEIRAGDTPSRLGAAGSCVAIMTGAGVPVGADAVVMIEYTKRGTGGDGAKRGGDFVEFERETRVGQNIVGRGSEAGAGQAVLTAGMRMGYAEVAVAAQVGATLLRCFRRPRVAILSTGDEIVGAEVTPGDFQIRNSNAYSLAAQVGLAGGEAVVLGNAADREEELKEKIALGLREDLLVLSGGVSMGKYDLVESVLRGMGAEFLFDAVAIRPGKPAVFAMCKGKPVFGLPGNPISTMVTFELFVKLAIEILSGAAGRELPLVSAVLGEDLQEKTGMTHFLPAQVEWRGEAAEVKALAWQGSGDMAAMAKANCFLVVGPEAEHVAAGTMVRILLRRDVV